MILFQLINIFIYSNKYISIYKYSIILLFWLYDILLYIIRYLWRNYIAHHTYHVDEYRGPQDDNTLLRQSYDFIRKIERRFRVVMKKKEREDKMRESVEQVWRLEEQVKGIMRGYNDVAIIRDEFLLTY